MKTTIGIVSRVMLLICALALTAVLFVPVWRIDLIAPQYPEGLYLLIYSNKLSGNVDVINGLNHYIGMKTLHSEDFIEFTVLPFLVGFFAVLFLIAAIVGKRGFLNFVFILFVLFGITAMVDFWKWEYNYGHNLNPDAPIKVPGMSYQPPLIGFKQLLNFSAYSMPDIGGWLFVAVGLLSLTTVVLAWRKKRNSSRVITMIVAGMFFMTLGSCSTAPQPIRVGTDNCIFCKMTISDARYGAEIVTKKGKVYKFDDAHCILSYLKSGEEAGEIYFTDFEGGHKLINVKDVLLFKSEALNTPMGGNIAALSSKQSLEQLAAKFPGTTVSWSELISK